MLQPMLQPKVLIITVCYNCYNLFEVTYIKNKIIHIHIYINMHLGRNGRNGIGNQIDRS